MKKIITLALASLMIVGAIVGGSIAYLTDEEKVENVFVLGEVDITMHELMREKNASSKNDPTKLVAFEQNQVLLPGFANPSWEKYEWGKADLSGYADAWAADALPSTCWNELFNSETYGVMDKFVFVENTGKTNAFFRTVIAVESPVGLSADALHLNISSYTDYDWNASTPEVDAGASNIEYIEDVMIDGVRYFIIVANYVVPLQPGEVARPSFLQIGLDAKATNEDMKLLGDELNVLVATQAIQCYGFETNALAALEAGFGKITAENNPFVTPAP